MPIKTYETVLREWRKLWRGDARKYVKAKGSERKQLQEALISAVPDDKAWLKKEIKSIEDCITAVKSADTRYVRWLGKKGIVVKPIWQDGG